MTIPTPHIRNNTASISDIQTHLCACNFDFQPALDRRVNLAEYAAKLSEKAQTFEAWDQGVLVGLVAVYLDDTENNTGFISNVSAVRPFQGRGLASKLVRLAIERAIDRGIVRMELEVDASNTPAMAVYRKLGFHELSSRGNSIVMQLDLSGEHMGN